VISDIADGCTKAKHVAAYPLSSRVFNAKFWAKVMHRLFVNQNKILALLQAACTRSSLYIRSDAAALSNLGTLSVLLQLMASIEGRKERSQMKQADRSRPFVKYSVMQQFTGRLDAVLGNMTKSRSHACC